MVFFSKMASMMLELVPADEDEAVPAIFSGWINFELWKWRQTRWTEFSSSTSFLQPTLYCFSFFFSFFFFSIFFFAKEIGFSFFLFLSFRKYYEISYFHFHFRTFNDPFRFSKL